ncbi:MAG TPA: FAD-binding oxidoreductase, partial [Pyrinomonadaceae bacterium]
MKISTGELAGRLSASLGGDAITAEESQLTAHAVDSTIAKLICTPATVEQLAAAVRICAEAQASIAPWGGGTAIILGNAPRTLDVVVKTYRLNRLIDHDHANLTATAQSGITLSALQTALMGQKQFVPFDPPLPERSTVGGIVAANLNGPRRSSYGSVRDLVIGIKVVLASGETIKAGGKVVKNVAGYDMCKLFTGSLGSLGIITELTLRVAPVPAQSATFIATGTLADVAECASQLTRTKLLPTIAYLIGSGEIALWQLAVSFDGFAETVERQTKAMMEIAQRLSLTHEAIDGAKQRNFWQAIAALPVCQDRLIYRLTVPRGCLTQTISTILDWIKIQPALKICADVGMGTAWLLLPANQPALELFPRLIALAQQQRGHAIIFAAPASLKKSIEVWGATTPAHTLMRKIKQEFDPMGLLNPG